MNGNVFAARPAWRATYQPPQPQQFVAQISPELGQNGAALAVASIPVIIWGAIGAAGTYVGIDYGIKEKGFKSFMGWVVGITSGISALAAITGIGLLGIAGAVQAMTPERSAQPGFPR